MNSAKSAKLSSIFPQIVLIEQSDNLLKKLVDTWSLGISLFSYSNNIEGQIKH